MSGLIELADRCERSTGADRDIDCWIENRLGLAKFVPDRPAPFGEGWLDKRVEPKPFTASLDAALTLVPKEYDWIIGQTNGGLTIHAEVGGRGDEFMRFASTPALALCAAALRARAAQGTSASGQDPKGLEAKPAGPVLAEDAPDPTPTGGSM